MRIYIRKNQIIVCEYMRIYANTCGYVVKSHKFAYMRIYAIHANLCKSFDIKYMRITNLCEYIRYRIYSISNTFDLFESNTFDRNRLFHIRINLHIFAMRIYVNLFEKSNACEFMRICAHA